MNSDHGHTHVQSRALRVTRCRPIELRHAVYNAPLDLLWTLTPHVQRCDQTGSFARYVDAMQRTAFVRVQHDLHGVVCRGGARGGRDSRCMHVLLTMTPTIGGFSWYMTCADSFALC